MAKPAMEWLRRAHEARGDQISFKPATITDYDTNREGVCIYGGFPGGRRWPSETRKRESNQPGFRGAMGLWKNDELHPFSNDRAGAKSRTVTDYTTTAAYVRLYTHARATVFFPFTSMCIGIVCSGRARAVCPAVSDNVDAQMSFQIPMDPDPTGRSPFVSSLGPPGFPWPNVSSCKGGRQTAMTTQHQRFVYTEGVPNHHSLRFTSSAVADIGRKATRSASMSLPAPLRRIATSLTATPAYGTLQPALVAVR